MSQKRPKGLKVAKTDHYSLIGTIFRGKGKSGLDVRIMYRCAVNDLKPHFWGHLVDADNSKTFTLKCCLDLVHCCDSWQVVRQSVFEGCSD